MKVIKRIIVGIFIFITMSGCGGDGFEYKPDTIPSNPNASDDAKAIQRYLAQLSSGEIKGTIVGQNCSHGNQISTPDYFAGYNKTVEDLYVETGRYVGMIGVDYEHDFIFTSDELSEANAVFIDFWNNGGLVTINWAPQSPWLNDESDLENDNGIWSNTRVQDVQGNNIADNIKDVNLNDLIDPAKPIYTVWRRKLDRVAGALAELRDAGVVVLWRPMQEMNGFWFWWGVATHLEDPQPYIDVYRDMYNYFTNEKGLDNLLWVYSPCVSRSESGDLYWNYVNIRPVEWAYPGDDYVDIVAGTAYHDELLVTDYMAYRLLNKPMGLGEYGPGLDGAHERNGTFDNSLYIEVIERNYPACAFWNTWHTWNDGTYAYHSLIHHRNSKQLLEHPLTITRDKLSW